MNTISLISLTLLVVSGSSAFRFSPRENFDKCEEIGLVCSNDCKTVEYCPKASGPSSTIRECTSGTFCGNKTGVPECDEKSCPTAKPICPGPGVMPSPTNCHIYYICTGQGDPNPFEMDCKDDVFNPITLLCDPNLKCPTPVACAKAGDNGFVDPDTKVYCYYCSDVNTPYVYPCPKKS